MQHRLVALVGNRTKQLALALTGVAQQREGLVGVRRDHHRVEALRLTFAR